MTEEWGELNKNWHLEAFGAFCVQPKCSTKFYDFFAHERESYSTLKLTWFYDAFTKLLWQTLAITSTKSKYGFVHISNSTFNFSKVAPNWIQ